MYLIKMCSSSDFFAGITAAASARQTSAHGGYDENPMLPAPAISDRIDVFRLLDADDVQSRAWLNNLPSYSAQNAMLLQVLTVVLVTMGR
jgi:hypothetical protein